MRRNIVIATEVKGKPYTDSEDRLLLTQVGHVPVRVMAEGLGRTPGGVHMRLAELRHQGRYQSSVKYKTPFRGHICPESENYQYFTKDEDTLIQLAFGRKSLEAIADGLGREKGSIGSRIRYLKRHGELKGKFPYGYRKFRPWTQNEVDYLFKNYGMIETSELAKELNRAIDAVERKASALTIRFRKRNYTAGEVAQMLGVRWENVRRWVKKGLFECFDSGEKSSHYYRFTYVAIANFIRELPGFYDPNKIRHARLKLLAMQVKEDGNEYLSINQASKLAEVPYYRLSYHLRKGHLRGFLILGPIAQRNWRIKKGDLHEWVNASNLRHSPIIRPTSILLFGEQEDIWPGRCTRNLQCQQCFIEGRLQCKPRTLQIRS